MNEETLKCPWCSKECKRLGISRQIKQHCIKAPEEVLNMGFKEILDTYFADFLEPLVRCPWCGEEQKRLGFMAHVKKLCKKVPLAVLKMSFDEIFHLGFYHPSKVEGIDYVICLLCKKEGKETRIKSLVHHLKSHKVTLEAYKEEFPEQEKLRADVYNDSVKQTWLKNYGVDHPFKSAEIQEKAIQTSLRNHGVEHPSQSPKIGEKISLALLNRTPEEKEEALQKMFKTNQERYGVDYNSQNLEIAKKIKNSHAQRTSEEKKKTLDQTIKTTQEHYGVDYPLQSSEIREKSKATMREIYGVEYAAQNPEVAQKIVNSHAMRTAEEKKKTLDQVKQTCQELYGVDNGAQSKESKEKLRQTCQERYGVDSTAQIPEVKAQISESLVQNHALRTLEEKAIQVQKRKETFALKSEIFSYIGRNGDTRYLHTINIPESKFNTNTLDNVMFTGDKTFYIATPEHAGTKSANPDFLVMPINETKKIIEIFGVYFHSERPGIPREKAEEDKITQYAQVGYQCLIIWDDHLKDEPERELKRAKDFCNSYWARPFEEDISLLKRIKVTRAHHKQIILKNIEGLLAREESIEELQKKKIRICQEVLKELSVE